ncbi:hypothetical protein Efla_001622 [Eimeria flavescens]
MAASVLPAEERARHLLQCLSTGIYCPFPSNYLNLRNETESFEAGEERTGIDDPGHSRPLPGGVTLEWLESLAAALRAGCLQDFSGLIDLSGHKQIGDTQITSLLLALRDSKSVSGLLLRDTAIGDSSAKLLSLLLEEVTPLVSLDVSRTRISELEVVRLCQAARKQRRLKRLCLPPVRQLGLLALISFVSGNRTLEHLELTVASSPLPLTDASASGLREPEGQQLGNLVLSPPVNPRGSSKKTKRQQIDIPNEEQDEVRSLREGDGEETAGSLRGSVEDRRRDAYIQEVKSLLLRLFAAYEDAKALRVLLLGDVGEDPQLRGLVLAFHQLASQRQLASQQQLASEGQLARERREQGAPQQSNKRRGQLLLLSRHTASLSIMQNSAAAAAAAAAAETVPPVPTRVYFSSMLEAPLTRGLVALAAAQTERPESVDSPGKQLAFLSSQLHEAPD